MALKLNLGCGEQYREGYVNCDVLPQVKADRYFDLDCFPYPLESDSADEILMDNVLEHLEDIPRVMAELHRVLKPGGRLKLIVPYAKTDWAFQDPTHRHYFTERSMDYFAAGTRYSFYSVPKFSVVKTELVGHTTNWMHKVRNLLPFKFVLRYFLFNIYDVIHFELMKVPPSPLTGTSGPGGPVPAAPPH